MRLNSAVLILAFGAAHVALCVPDAAFSDERPAWRDDPLGSRFALGAGLFAPRLDTQVRRDSSDGIIGTVIDFESTLGMDDSDRSALMLGYYRFAKKHRIGFQHFRLDRNGDSGGDDDGDGIVSVTISPESNEVEVGERARFRAQAYDADGNRVRGIDFEWTVVGNIGNIDCHKVTSNEEEGFSALMGRLIAEGYSRFGFLGGLKGINTSDIKVNLRNPASLNLEVTNIMGQIVYTQTLDAKPGMNKFTLDATELSEGLYFYTVKAGTSSVTKKMLVD